MNVPPVASEVKGPKVWVVPLGLLTTIVMLPQRSPYTPFAVGGGSLSQKFSVTVWPTPIGFGATFRKAKVGMDCGGLCASTSEEEIEIAITEIAKSRTSVVAIDLFIALKLSILLFAPKSCILVKQGMLFKPTHKQAPNTKSAIEAYCYLFVAS